MTSSIDAALAAIPVLVDEVRALRRELEDLRDLFADKTARWVSPSAWARENGVSVDTAYRKIAAGDLVVKELGRRELLDEEGNPRLDKKGRPRVYRTLRVKLMPAIDEISIKRIAAEMTAPNGAGVRAS